MPNWRDIRSSFRQTYDRFFSPLTIFVWVLAIVSAILAAPFGIKEIMAPGPRAIYCVTVITTAIVVGYAVRALVAAVVGTRPGRGAVFDLAAVLTMTVVFSPLAWMLKIVFARPGADLGAGFVVTFAHVLVISTAVFGARRLIPGLEGGSYRRERPAKRSAGRRTRPARPPAEPEPRLMRRLSPDMRGRILRITADDHHVQVVTEHGQQALRLRLADAIDEMDPVPGVRPHRSHWVARAAIVGIDRDTPQKLFLVLGNRDRVPVSRKHRPRLEAEGVLAPGGVSPAMP